MYRPTSSAIGIVQAIVNVPQELPGTRRTALAETWSVQLPPPSESAIPPVRSRNSSLNFIDWRPSPQTSVLPAGMQYTPVALSNAGLSPTPVMTLPAG